jgi:hypothetical protein
MTEFRVSKVDTTTITLTKKGCCIMPRSKMQERIDIFAQARRFSGSPNYMMKHLPAIISNLFARGLPHGWGN